jgi:hypothetical protein
MFDTPLPYAALLPSACRALALLAVRWSSQSIM